MSLPVWFIIFIVSIAVLVKASGYFTLAAEIIGRSIGLPSFVIGVVIVGFGTSLPELVSSIVSVARGSSEIVIGNVLGSNITNIFLVLGLVAVVKKNIRIDYDIMHVDLPVLLGSAFLVTIMVWDLKFSRIEAILCILCLVFYFFSSYLSSKEKKEVPVEPGAVVTEPQDRKKASLLAWGLLAASGVFIFFGANYVVESVIAMSRILRIGTEIIALSAVAVGTSLPEISVALASARRGNTEMVVGNIIGSNIFNAFAVMGIPALFGELRLPEGILDLPLPVYVAATVLSILITLDRKINRWEGALLLAFYIFFIGKLFGLM